MIEMIVRHAMKDPLSHVTNNSFRNSNSTPRPRRDPNLGLRRYLDTLDPVY